MLGQSPLLLLLLLCSKGGDLDNRFFQNLSIYVLCIPTLQIRFTFYAYDVSTFFYVFFQESRGILSNFATSFVMSVKDWPKTSLRKVF